MTLESLEPRRALAVTAPTIRLTGASDTGVKGDGITRVARPVFAGQVTPGATVTVSLSGDPSPLGVAKANLKGAWSLATPVTRAFSPGDYVVTAVTIDTIKNEQSSPAPLWIRVVDTSPPVASLAYDQVNGVATLSFSKPVIGVTRASLRLVGTTSEGVAINVRLSDPSIAAYVGSVSMEKSPDGATYVFRERFVLAEPGNFRIVLVARGSRIADIAGNPLVAGVTTSFRII